jgi:hypothetical protein
MSRLYRAVAAAFTAALVSSAAQADGPNTSAQGLLSAWKGDDRNMRMVAEVIASAFASGLSWRGTLAGKEVYCPPQGLEGAQVMAALDQFLASNPTLPRRHTATRWRSRLAVRSRARHNKPARGFESDASRRGGSVANLAGGGIPGIWPPVG